MVETSAQGRHSQLTVGGVQSFAVVLYLTATMTLIQTYLVVKLLLLCLVAGSWAILAIAQRQVILRPRIIAFYLAVAVLGIGWFFVGLARGNHPTALSDSAKLYVAWSVVIGGFYSMLRSKRSLHLFHRAIVASAILIAVMNIVGVLDQVLGWGLVPAGVRLDLDLRVGLHEGYVQVTSRNIGALFFIAPYLIAFHLRSDGGAERGLVSRLALLMALIVAGLSGRRALWLVVLATPVLIVSLSLIIHGWERLRPGGRRLLFAFGFAGVLGVGVLAVQGASTEDVTLRHLMSAFSSQDERSIQRPFLIRGFADHQILGSGFGAFAGHRSPAVRPWIYELTYHQMLFNLGLVGFGLLAGLFAVYGIMVVRTLRRYRAATAVPFGLCVGWGGMLAAAASNPYLGSFDFLVLVGILPYLASFDQGFDERERTA